MKQFLTGVEAALEFHAEQLSEAARFLRELREIHLQVAAGLCRRKRRGELVDGATINDHVISAREVNHSLVRILRTRRYLHSLQYDILTEAL